MVNRTSLIIKRTFPILLLASVAGAQASDYQWELSGFYGQAETPTTDQDDVSLSGRYHFSPVETDSHPLAEAAFLERASNISFGHTRSDRSSDDIEYRGDDFSYTLLGSDSTSDVSSLNAEVYVPGDLFYLGLGVSRRESETSSRSFSDTRWNASLGLTPVDGLLVYSTFFEDQDLDKNWNLNGKYVFDTFGPTIAIKAGYDYDDLRVDRLSLSLDYYLDRTLSVGYQRNDAVESGPGDIDDHQISIRKFFGDQWSLEGFYSESDVFDGFGVVATVRF